MWGEGAVSRWERLQVGVGVLPAGAYFSHRKGLPLYLCGGEAEVLFLRAGPLFLGVGFLFLKVGTLFWSFSTAGEALLHERGSFTAGREGREEARR